MMEKWTPAATGAGFEFTPILKPLEPFRDARDRRQRDERTDPRATHSPQRVGVLSGSSARRNAPKRRMCGRTTIDQMIAEQIGQDTPFPRSSWRRKTSPVRRRLRQRLRCAYVNTMSWRTPTTPLPDGNQSARRLRAAVRRRGTRRSAWRACGMTAAFSTPSRGRRASIAGWARATARGSATTSRTSREIERRSSGPKSKREPRSPCRTRRSAFPTVRGARGSDVRPARAGLSRPTDARRHFMMARELSQRTYPQIGVHGPPSLRLAPPRAEEGKWRGSRRSTTITCPACSRGSCTSRQQPEGDGSLLDHSMLSTAAA